LWLNSFRPGPLPLVLVAHTRFYLPFHASGSSNPFRSCKRPPSFPLNSSSRPPVSQRCFPFPDLGSFFLARAAPIHYDRRGFFSRQALRFCLFEFAVPCLSPVLNSLSVPCPQRRRLASSSSPSRFQTVFPLLTTPRSLIVRAHTHFNGDEPFSSFSDPSIVAPFPVAFSYAARFDGRRPHLTLPDFFFELCKCSLCVSFSLGRLSCGVVPAFSDCFSSSPAAGWITAENQVGF